MPSHDELPVLEDLPDLRGRRVLVRSDLNVPLRAGRLGVEVADDRRIRASLATIRFLVEAGATVTVVSHLGRPGGRVDERYAMAPVRARLLGLLGAEVAPAVVVGENLRFDPGEEANDPAFVLHLVDGFDAYVDDAFGAAHRTHASIVGPPAFLPSAAGRLLAREASVLGSLLGSPKRPFVALVGGLKVSGKLRLLRSLCQKIDALLVGGAMAFTFLAASGRAVGDSPVEGDLLEEARELLRGCPGLEVARDVVALGALPARRDAPLGPEHSSGGDPGGGEVRRFGAELPAGWRGLDIGPETAASFAGHIAGAGTVLWNGPMGLVEDPRFEAGTRQVATAVARCPGLSVAGGGDTVAALDRFGLADRLDHVSSGGGAMLTLLAEGDLPGLAALRVAARRDHGGPWRAAGLGRGAVGP